MTSNQPDNTGNKQKNGGMFKKGQSGNPKGRPKGSLNKSTLAVQALLEGEAEIITNKLIEIAKNGDMAAIKLIMERILPPVKELPVTVDLGSDNIKANNSLEGIKNSIARIIQAACEGTITPTQAQKLSNTLEYQRKAIETYELEQRLTALEEKR